MNLSTICYFLFYPTVVQYFSPESTGLKIFFYLIFSFIIADSGTNNSGSDQIRIHNTGKLQGNWYSTVIIVILLKNL